MSKNSFRDLVAHYGIVPADLKPESLGHTPSPTVVRAANLLPPDAGADGSFAEQSFYAKNGIDRRRLNALQKATPADCLDLHGLTAAAAHDAVADFLHVQIANGRRHVEIIHGRGEHSSGKAVLRAKVRKWLTTCDAVLGYVESRNNPGAVRVLLRHA